MDTFSALLALSAGTQGPVARSFDVFLALCLNKRFSKQRKRRWFKTPLYWLWWHCNGVFISWRLITETEMSSFWWNYHHWQHWKLSKWQLPVQSVMKISSKWRHFRFSDVMSFMWWNRPYIIEVNRRHMLSRNWVIFGSDSGSSVIRRQLDTYVESLA